MTLQEFFNQPEKWCKGTCARDDRGQSVLVTGAKACSWCLIGGMIILGIKSYSRLQQAAIKLEIGLTNEYRLSTNENDVCLGATNDSLTWKQFQEWLKEAGV